MKIKSLNLSANRSILAFSILAGLVWGYSIACHFFDLYLKSWDERALILLAAAAIAGLHVYKLVQVSLPRLKTLDYAALIRNTLLLTGLAYLLVPSILPVFPMMRKLEIAATGKKNGASTGSIIEITSIHINGEPIQFMNLSGEWDQSGDNFRTTGNLPASLSYAQFIRNKTDIQITFRTSPDSGKAVLTWDGVKANLDLYSAASGHDTINLAPDFPWNKLGLMRQAFLVTTIISDFLGLSILILAIETWLVSFFLQFKPAQSLAKAGSLILVVCLVFSLAWNIFNIKKSQLGQEILTNPMTTNQLNELLARSSSFKRAQIYTYLAEMYAGRSLIISHELVNELDLDTVQIMSTGRITSIKQESYPVELTDAEAQGLLKLGHRDLVYDPAQPKYTYMVQSPGADTPLCVKTYQGTIFIGPVDLIPGCKSLP
jgi:hypothetical protein